MARRVDLADDALPLPLAHKLMTGNSGEWIIAARQLEIGVADAREQHAHERLARRRHWPRQVIAKRKSLILEP
jgi:hypothetical protein